MKGSYEILIRRSAEKEIRDLPISARARVVDRIRALVDEPRPPGCEKLSGREAYRVRVGEYRVIYTIEDRVLVVEVVRVAHRKDAYRRW
jgi:mRNA interferase RelE/StbE